MDAISIVKYIPFEVYILHRVVAKGNIIIVQKLPLFIMFCFYILREKFFYAVKHIYFTSDCYFLQILTFFKL